MKFILILIMVKISSGSIAIGTAEFSDYDACVIGGIAAQAEDERLGTETRFACAPKENAFEGELDEEPDPTDEPDPETSDEL
jgi:hypothetical protein